jgi:hypothetical protein
LNSSSKVQVHEEPSGLRGASPLQPTGAWVLADLIPRAASGTAADALLGLPGAAVAGAAVAGAAVAGAVVAGAGGAEELTGVAAGAMRAAIVASAIQRLCNIDSIASFPNHSGNAVGRCARLPRRDVSCNEANIKYTSM